jgi:ectoine hydroxylase-related dioxygenase (phytanoyl-CoA dioxygenase family)
VTIGSIEEALRLAGVTDGMPTPSQRDALDREGYVVLRGVYDAERVARLADTFERRYVPSDRWPAPRGHDTRHAMLNDELEVQRACLAPEILACVHHMLRRRFFLSDVQGRDPLPGGGQQNLHRDWVAPNGPAPMVIVLAFLDPFAALNGATRVLPGTHVLAGGADVSDDREARYPDEIVVEGAAGDVLVMDGYLAHSGMRNGSDQKRRNLQINFLGFEMHRGHVETRDFGGVPAHLRYLMGQEA